MNVLIVGVTGMLGSTVLSFFQKQGVYEVWGTLRNTSDLNYFPKVSHKTLITGIDVLNHDALCDVIVQAKPSVVINCIGLVKQLATVKDPLIALPINAMFPHRLAKLCALASTRLIHISTDCVFSGSKGNYVETDRSDAEDLYGKSKFIGELTELSHAITLRTSMIGHELQSKRGLIDWFLSQTGAVKGFTQAVFSGLPTIELARVIHDYIVPNPFLSGLYHVAADPINKYDLLALVAEIYQKKVSLIRDDELVINRSLNAEHFREATGYCAPSWPKLISLMHKERQTNNNRNELHAI